MSENALYDGQGNRLYLTVDERAVFMDTARTAARSLKCFCHVLHYAGCRLSEALELTARHIDITGHCLRIRCLKKRGGKIVFREVPVPPALIEASMMCSACVKSSVETMLVISMQSSGLGRGSMAGVWSQA